MFQEKIKYCRTCGNIGHKKGLCTSDTLEILFDGTPDTKIVLLYSSMDNWTRGEKMTKAPYSNTYSIVKIFKIGRNEFKFQIDGNRWESSSRYPLTSNNQGIANNYIDIKSKSGDCVIFRSNHNIDNLILGTDNDIIEFIIILNQISIEEIIERTHLHFKNSSPLKDVQIWGSWNDFSEGEHMNSYCDKTSRLQFWTLKKSLPRGIYHYKFRIGGEWVLDPFRETVQSNEFFNHPLDFEDIIKSDYFELNKPLIDKKVVHVRSYEHEELLDVELTGHTINSIGNKVYIFGGKDRDSYTNNIFEIELNPFRLNLIEVADSQGPKSIGFHKTITYGEKLIVYGGHNEMKVSDSYYTYSTLNRIWTTYKIENSLIREMYSAVYKKFTSRIYIFGGFYCHPDSEGEFHYNDLQVLYLNLMRFQSLNTKNPPLGRYSHSAVIINWSMFIFGGCRNEGMNKRCFNDLYRINLFDHDDLVWQEIKPKGLIPAKRFNHLFLSYGGQLILHGGTGEGIHAPLLGDLWIFDIKSLCWSEIQYDTDIDFRRAHHAGCIVDNTLIIFGGKTHWSCEYSDKILQLTFDFSE
jgi:hypothetical protein